MSIIPVSQETSTTCLKQRQINLHNYFCSDSLIFICGEENLNVKCQPVHVGMTIDLYTCVRLGNNTLS